MYEPRREEEIDLDEVDVEALKNQISKLEDEINAMNIEDISEARMSEEDVIQILQDENASLEEFLEFERKRNEELQNELNALSGYVEEEEYVKAAVREYMKKEGKFKMEAVSDEEKEFHHKSEALVIRLRSLIKSFAHSYDCDENHPTDQPRSSKRAKRTHHESDDQKSLLDILKLLLMPASNPISDLGGTRVTIEQELEIDETISDKHIQFLLSANIIERCSDNPNKVKLVEPLSAMC